MEYDVKRIEFVKTQKTRYVIQTSEHIFQINIDCIAHNDIFLKDIFSLCFNIFCEVFYLLCCFAFAEFKCFWVTPHWYVYFQLLYDTMDFYKCKLNMKLQMNYLQKDNWTHLLKCCCAINSSYKVLHVGR